MPSFDKPILKGSPLRAALAVFNYVHEDNIGLSVHARFPSEYELYQVGLRTFSRSFRIISDVRIIGNLRHEVPEALGSVNDPLWERFGHPTVHEVPELIEDPQTLPFDDAWLSEVEDEQEDGYYGYDDGVDSNDTDKKEPQIC
ncbi:unnamed protein product [Orchesella dallaii]|uniref:Uncharacterized protein n=1 Tax=Orchesella dallaii TaxID=48710 RepID=A0ABP1RBP0_9HEXA